MFGARSRRQGDRSIEFRCAPRNDYSQGAQGGPSNRLQRVEAQFCTLLAASYIMPARETFVTVTTMQHGVFEQFVVCVPSIRARPVQSVMALRPESPVHPWKSAVTVAPSTGAPNSSWTDTNASGCRFQPPA